ncbi:MAG: hypothetical protein JNM61_00435 [Zoogloeaceae bacterium]|nr:hypothetical protein [Zoogloeaceae bacterium]
MQTSPAREMAEIPPSAWPQIGGGIEKIEKGDEFMTIHDQIVAMINSHLILWDAPGTGWNQYPR